MSNDEVVVFYVPPPYLSLDNFEIIQLFENESASFLIDEVM